ncbi:MAG: uroporphyrinogen decarboxylase [Thermaerobacter sp.]|nr:uroporphyrinogen decarboxylase [Bacillota bacterium]REJ38164.1 MAG: uroporphyrinogen decarboxylase [Bacillota bacterium]
MSADTPAAGTQPGAARGTEPPAPQRPAPEQRFLAACRRRPTDRTPVWFMRQAGRIFPEYRALRERYDFLTLCRTPDLITQVTLMPLEPLGVDAAIIFADIMLPLEALGIAYDLREGTGPVIQQPVRTAADVARLARRDPREANAYLYEGIRQVKRELGGRLPLIGFAGAPFTLACYLVEGRSSREFTRARALMHGDPAAWHALMDVLSDTILDYLRAQVEAGVDAVQLFDSWVGGLSPWDYEEFVMPYSARILQGLAGTGVPRIHFGTGTATLLPLMARAGADVVGVDWRIGLDEAWDRIGPGYAVQGNLDPAVLLGPWEAVERRARDVLRRVGGRPGHIFNLGHGVLPGTPVDHLRRLVELVHSTTAAG